MDCQKQDWAQHKAHCRAAAVDEQPAVSEQSAASEPAPPPPSWSSSVSDSPPTKLSKSEEFEQQLQLGLELHRASEYEDAYAHFTRMLPDFPNEIKLYEARSQSALLTGRLRQAHTDCQKAVDLSPPTALKPRIRLLKVLLREGDLDEALVLGEAVLKLDETNASVRSDLQTIKLNQRRLVAAEESFNERRLSECVALTNQVTKESPACRQALLLRAKCFVEMGEWDDALQLTTRILIDDDAKGKSLHDVLFLRSRIFFEQERFDQAQKHLGEMLRENPDDSNAARLLKRVKRIVKFKTEADLQFKTGHHQDAELNYTNCLGECGDSVLAGFRSKLHSNRAAALVGLGKLEDAVKDCDQAIALDPNFARAYMRRATCLRQLGGKERLERAVQDLEKAAELELDGAREQLSQAKHELKLAKRKPYYALLGIEPSHEQTATTEEIKKAYKRAALKYHPDRHTNSSEEDKAKAEATFKDVSEALMVLSDPQKRRLFDQGLDLEEIDQRMQGGHHGHSHSGGFGGGHSHGGGFGGGGGFDPNMFGRGGFPF